MNRDPYYWQLHKKIFAIKINQLDGDIYNKIISDPYCEAANLLNKVVEKEVYVELEKLVPKYEEEERK